MQNPKWARAPLPRFLFIYLLMSVRGVLSGLCMHGRRFLATSHLVILIRVERNHKDNKILSYNTIVFL